MRTAYGMHYGLCAASHTAPPCARTLDGLGVPEAVLPGGRVLHVRVFQGHQSPKAWCDSFAQAMAHECGGCLWRSSQDAGTGAASKEEQSSVHHSTSLEESIGYHGAKD